MVQSAQSPKQQKPAVRYAYTAVKGLKKCPPLWSLLQKVYYSCGREKDVVVEAEGNKYIVDPKDHGIGQLLYLSGNYGKGRTDYIREHVKEGDYVVDAGANIGFFTMQLAKAVGDKGKVIAIEPDERNFKYLKRNIELNGYKNIIPVMKAVSNENTVMRFYQTESQTANTLVAQEGATETEIEVISLDSFLPTINVDHIDFMKIDTDGSEPLAMKGMVDTIKNSPDFVMLAEYMPSNVRRYYEDPMMFLTVAEECGLKLETIIDTESGPIENQDIEVMKDLADDENYDLILRRA